MVYRGDYLTALTWSLHSGFLTHNQNQDQPQFTIVQKYHAGKRPVRGLSVRGLFAIFGMCPFHRSNFIGKSKYRITIFQDTLHCGDKRPRLAGAC